MLAPALGHRPAGETSPTEADGETQEVAWQWIRKSYWWDFSDESWDSGSWSLLCSLPKHSYDSQNIMCHDKEMWFNVEIKSGLRSEDTVYRHSSPCLWASQSRSLRPHLELCIPHVFAGEIKVSEEVTEVKWKDDVTDKETFCYE